MNCLHVQTVISAYIDSEIDVAEKRRLRQHLFSCPECSLEYEELLKLKSYLESMSQETLDFDPVLVLRARLEQDDSSLLDKINRIYWLNRLSLVGAWLLVFFISSILLFPQRSGLDQLAVRRSGDTPRSPNGTIYDQNFSIDQSVNVYQASLMFP